MRLGRRLYDVRSGSERFLLIAPGQGDVILIMRLGRRLYDVRSGSERFLLIAPGQGDVILIMRRE